MIVKSILDTDLYKFTTSYACMKLFPQARGTFEFFDRDLTEYPEDFVQKVYLELSNLGMLRLTNSELDYMTSNCRFVPQVYWEWLYSFRFNSGKVQVWLDDKKHLHITVTDYLYKVTLYEVPILAIISELRNRVLGNNCDMSEVIKKLEPRFRVGVAGQDGFYHVDMVDELNADLCEDDDPYTIDDCPIVHYVGGFETDRDRDSAMTNASSEDIAFIRSKSKWDSGTAENILRRHTMKYLNPSFYGQQ